MVNFFPVVLNVNKCMCQPYTMYLQLSVRIYRERGSKRNVASETRWDVLTQI